MRQMKEHSADSAAGAIQPEELPDRAEQGEAGQLMEQKISKAHREYYRGRLCELYKSFFHQAVGS